MTTFLDKAYGVKSPDDVRQLYDDWSGSYDAEITAAGYATPGRIALALLQSGADPRAPLLDFGCGTGVSGAALREAGFAVLDGVDLSPAMLAEAEAKGLYRSLRAIGPDEPPPEGYAAIAAIGVIGPGAAPLPLLDRLIAALPPGGRLGFSLNDHALAKPGYQERIAEIVSSGAIRVRHVSHGPHLPGIGLEAKVFVFQHL